MNQGGVIKREFPTPTLRYHDIKYRPFDAEIAAGWFLPPAQESLW
jgi:hypothetical protein